VRRFRWMALALAACMLCACVPIASGSAVPASASPPASQAATMSDRINTPAPPQPAGTPSPLPTQTAPPTAPDPEDFSGFVAWGLAARWPGGQAVVVRAKGADSSDAEMWLCERDGDMWKVFAGPWPAVVGRNGVGKRAEGDGRSPSGAFMLGAAFGRAEAPEGLRYPYRFLDESDRWVEEISSPFYNRWVRCPASVSGEAEDLDGVMQYKHALAVRYNDEAVPGAGSAIFMHVWKGPGVGTAGCTAISDENMLALLEWLDYAERPVLVQGTQEQIERLMDEPWGMLCLPQGWGFADDAIPDAQLDIRYNTDNNFTGRRLPGYTASLAPMRTEAIEALARVAAELRGKGYGIRVYDAYRPQRASDAMIAWAQDADDTATKEAYYPGIDKADIPNGFVARKSAHRLGGTVDLTLMDWKTGKNLDMGGPFDFFGDVSAYGYGRLTAKQAANRKLLRDAMVQYGFEPYDREWWHFTFPAEGDGGDFDILPREHQLFS
jgi:D-alanyl-D-alanine dipeptidase